MAQNTPKLEQKKYFYNIKIQERQTFRDSRIKEMYRQIDMADCLLESIKATLGTTVWESQKINRFAFSFEIPSFVTTNNTLIKQSVIA